MFVCLFVSAAHKWAIKWVIGGVSSLSVAPKVRLTPPGPLRVRMGEPVSVECRATGRPRPTLTWKRQGSTLQLVTSETNDVNTIQVKYERK